MQIDELNPGEIKAGTERIHVDRGNGFESLPLSPQGGGLFLAELYGGPDCGTPIRYYFSAQSNSAGITWTYPAGAPSAFLSATSANREQIAFDDPAEIDLGWTVGDIGDSATTGIWELADPEGTGAQPEDDHTPTGTQCWFTGQGSASLGSNDVDGGSTTLFSPVMDATGMNDPVLSYWRWYSNDQGFTPDDEFVVEISNNAGATWFPLETLTNSTTGWERFRVNVSDVLPPTNQMQLKFIATDALTGSIVEAAVDDLTISEFRCRGDRRKVRGLLAR